MSANLCDCNTVYQLLLLKDKLLHKDDEGSENPKLLDMPTELSDPVLALSSEGEVSETPIPMSKREDMCSGKSEMFDSSSDSPHVTEQSSLLEPADSSYAFEPEQSDLSQDEEDIPGKSFLNVFPKPVSSSYPDNLAASSSCHFRFQAGEQDNGFWSWSY